MKIKEEYLMRELAGNHVVVATGKTVLDFNGVITLNKTAAFLWGQLQIERSEEELMEALLAEYAVNQEIARADLVAFIARLKAADLLA